jgi:hypothetical protein
MPTQAYRIGGVRVPSVTTILKRCQDSGGLMHWAWACGRDGLDYRDERAAAADAGTLAHALIEADIRGAAAPLLFEYPEDVAAGASAAFAAYRKWRASSGLVPVHTEVSLTSERHRFGGTFDAVVVGAERLIVDWKTSKRIYSDHIVQLGGYAVLYDEHFPDEPLAGGMVLRFGRDGSGFEAHRITAGQLKHARAAFLCARQLYACLVPIDKFLRRSEVGGPPDDIATDSINDTLARIEADDAA